MDQFRKRSLVHALSRQNTDRSTSDSAVSQSNTVASDFSLLDINGDLGNEKGPLGLNTLCEPHETTAKVDIIFIHGLGGGSRKTWAKSTDPRHFWPKAWLSQDPEFQDVRVHSFGYNADWGERRQSILSIHDFAQSLLGELKNNPLVRRDDTKLILVGHSMGGCVAKKAYILARQDSTCRALAERIHSIFFLGTPHRGSDLATILHNMLTVAWGAKPFVNDLLPNCSNLAEINDAFRHYAQDLQLWSFYETLPVRAKVTSKLVVEKYSATLGYNNEEISSLDADHRHVCKFDNESDPNYKKLRNALCTAVDLVRAEYTDSTPRESLLKLERVLNISDTVYEDDLTALQELRHPGSCVWFTERPHLTAWKNGLPMSPPIFWLTGRPATGKSVICSHVIDQLNAQNLRCSYFFFKHGKAGRSTLADCFRGLAYQMALTDMTVAHCILQLDRDGDSWDQHDEKSIWRKLFVNNIFKLNTMSTHIWVIDGLDECLKFSIWFKLVPQLPNGIRIFMTSRSVDEIERGITSLGSRVQVQPLISSDTAEDMHSYLRTKLEDLSLDNVDQLCDRILVKSQGSFLWIRLVLQEFENAYTDEDIEAILQEVPDDLYEMYLRMLETIESEKRRTKLAKSILTWVTLACRPLTIDELRCAIKIDINETPHNMEKVIPTVCGQLVFIDQASRVHMIHETAREFILAENLDSSLAVRKGDRHGHLAFLLCRYLATDVLKMPQGLKPNRSAKLSSVLDISLLGYAANFFSEHLYRSNSQDEAPMSELCKLLRGNILYWFELIARGGDLQPISRTAINLAGYLRRRTKYVPPVDKNIQTVDAWATDCIRVSARFRSKLLGCPSSIHCLIPPFCPTDSIISTLFTTPTRSLIVKGARQLDWDDCLIRIDFQKGQTTTVAHGTAYFAVGMSTGQVSLYHSASIQHVSIMRHPERVRLLVFSGDERYLASGGQKHIVVWEPTSGLQVWSFKLAAPPLAMSFSSPEILVHANRANQIITSNLETSKIVALPWDSVEKGHIVPDQPPSKAAFSTELGLLAVGYRSHPILILDIESGALLGQCSSGNNNGIDAMTFNPNAEIFALVVSNTDGDLLVFDPQISELRFHRSNVYAHTLACSADGRNLVTGNSRGSLEVYDFDGPESTSLSLIYRINANEESVRSVAFSEDGLRIVDCRESQARVWEPAILAQKNTDIGSQSDISSQVTLALKTFGILEGPPNPEITALVCHSSGEHVICGKSSGDIALYSTAEGQEMEVLYGHSRGTSIISVAIAEQSRTLVSADESGRILVARMTELKPYWSKPEIIVDRRFSCAISGMLVNHADDRILISGKDIDELWALPSGEVIAARESAGDGLRTMTGHPSTTDSFIMFHTTVARVFDWLTFKEVGPDSGLNLQRNGLSSNKTTLVSATYHGGSPIVEAVKAVGEGSGTHLFCWDLASSSSVILGSTMELLNPVLRDVIAVIGSTLIFLDKDLWVCSLDLNNFNSAPYAKRHFFILSEWLNVNGDMLYAFTTRKDFVFVNKHGLIIVKAGLDFSEVIALSPQQGWTAHSGSMHRRTSSSIVPTLGNAGGL
ncbi:hypothetical protein BJ170DRAFT_616746 [Xylariales sp. AK1849]|nr:hypothetical protein BJ170DRAFT_616746 [Xylariales sp. AK1849]